MKKLSDWRQMSKLGAVVVRASAVAFGLLVSAAAVHAETVGFNIYDTTNGNSYGQGTLEVSLAGSTLTVSNIQFNITGWCIYQMQNPVVSTSDLIMLDKGVHVVGLRDNCQAGDSQNFEAMFLVDEPAGAVSLQAYGYIVGRTGGGGPFTVGRQN